MINGCAVSDLSAGFPLCEGKTETDKSNDIRDLHNPP